MTKFGVFNYKYRIGCGLIGFFLLYLISPLIFWFQSVGAYSLSSLIITIMLAPARPLPEEGPLVVLLAMFFWGSVGFFLGYVKDRFNVSKVKGIKRSDKNMQMTNPYIDKIIKTLRTKAKREATHLEMCLGLQPISC
jgi:apolipoprotein N-acyltransferase